MELVVKNIQREGINSESVSRLECLRSIETNYPAEKLSTLSLKTTENVLLQTIHTPQLVHANTCNDAYRLTKNFYFSSRRVLLNSNKTKQLIGLFYSPEKKAATSCS